MNTAITALETLVLTAIALSEFHDEPNVADRAEATVWVDCCVDTLDITPASLGGVFSSLNKKGLAWSDGTHCAITEAGIAALPPAILAA